MPRWIIGNWKMHKTSMEAREFVEQIPALEEVNLALAVPYTLIAPLREMGSLPCEIGGQNISEFAEGPYTGEISGRMLSDVRAQFVLVGHSERRHIFKETNEQVCAKFERCIVENIPVILCVGETKDQCDRKETLTIIEEQLSPFMALTKKQLPLIKIAYEPVWAIGTGKAASDTEIEERHQHIREHLAKLFSAEAAKQVPILYGGSVCSDNIDTICQLEDVDGALVGSASLDIKKFNAIISKVAV